MYKWSVINATKRLRISTFVKSKGSHDIGNNKFRHWIVVDAFISPLHYNWWRMRACGQEKNGEKWLYNDTIIYIHIFDVEWQWGEQIKSVFVLDACSRCISPSIHYLLIFAHEWTNNLLLLVSCVHIQELAVFSTWILFVFGRAQVNFLFLDMLAIRLTQQWCVCVCRHISIPVLSNWNSYFNAWRWLFLLFLTLGIKSQCNGKIDFQIGKVALGGERIFIHSRWWCNRKQCKQQQKKAVPCVAILDLCSPNCMWAL